MLLMPFFRVMPPGQSCTADKTSAHKLHFREGMAEAFTSCFSTCQKSGLKPGPVWPAPFNGWEEITNICIFDFRCALGALENFSKSRLAKKCKSQNRPETTAPRPEFCRSRLGFGVRGVVNALRSLAKGACLCFRAVPFFENRKKNSKKNTFFFLRPGRPASHPPPGCSAGVAGACPRRAAGCTVEQNRGRRRAIRCRSRSFFKFSKIFKFF